MSWAEINTLRQNLRERRLKENTDYALTFKYDRLYILCHVVWVDAIQEECARLDLAVTAFLAYT